MKKIYKILFLLITMFSLISVFSYNYISDAATETTIPATDLVDLNYSTVDELKIAESTMTEINNYTSTWTLQDKNNRTYEVVNGSNNGGAWDFIRFGKSQTTNGVGSLSTKFPIAEKISRVRIHMSIVRDGLISAKLKVYPTSVMTGSAHEVVEISSLKEGYRYFDILNPIENAYYKLEFIYTNDTNSNGIVDVDYIGYQYGSFDIITEDEVVKEPVGFDLGMNLLGKVFIWEAEIENPQSGIFEFENGYTISYGTDFSIKSADGESLVAEDVKGLNYFDYYGFKFFWFTDDDWILSKCSEDITTLSFQYLKKYYVLDFNFKPLFEDYLLFDPEVQFMESDTLYYEASKYLSDEYLNGLNGFVAYIKENDNYIRCNGEYRIDTIFNEEKRFQISTTNNFNYYFILVNSLKTDFNIYLEIDGYAAILSNASMGEKFIFKLNYYEGKKITIVSAYEYIEDLIDNSSFTTGKTYNESLSTNKDSITIFSDVVFKIAEIEEEVTQKLYFLVEGDSIGDMTEYSFNYGENFNFKKFYNDNVWNKSLGISNFEKNNKLFNTLDEFYEYIKFNYYYESNVLFDINYEEKELHYYSDVLTFPEGSSNIVKYSEFTNFSVPGYTEPYTDFVITGYYYDKALTQPVGDLSVFQYEWANENIDVVTNIYIDAYINPIRIDYTYSFDNGIITGSEVIYHTSLDTTHVISLDYILDEGLINIYNKDVTFKFNGELVGENNQITLSRETANVIEILAYSNTYNKLAKIVFYEKNIIVKEMTDKYDVLINTKLLISSYFTEEFSCELYQFKFYLNEKEVTEFIDIYNYFINGVEPTYSYVVRIDIVKTHDDLYYGPTTIYKKSTSVLTESQIQNLLKRFVAKCDHITDVDFLNIDYLGNASKEGIYSYKIIFTDDDGPVEYTIKIEVLKRLNSDYIFGNILTYSLDKNLTTSQIVSDLKLVGYFPDESLKTSFNSQTSIDESFIKGELNEPGLYTYLVEYSAASGTSGNSSVLLNVTEAENFTTDDAESSCKNIDTKIITDILAVIVIVIGVVVVIKLIKKKR